MFDVWRSRFIVDDTVKECQMTNHPSPKESRSPNDEARLGVRAFVISHFPQIFSALIPWKPSESLRQDIPGDEDKAD